MDNADLHDLFDLEQQQHVRRKHVTVDLLNSYTNNEFKQRFRLRKDTVIHLCEEMFPMLRRTYQNGLTVMEQMLITLRFLATGSFQITCADLGRVSQSSVSRTLRRCITAILSLRPRIIRFPEDVMAVKHQFYEIAHFPGVIALTDGTHIPIIKPVEGEAEVYRNRKGFYSLNVQLTCGPDMQIYNVVARWPGSTHDNRILENSSLHHRLSTNQLRGIILADGGYGNKRFLLTPVREPNTDAQRRYNRSHIRTRNLVERTIGVLKRRFGCLSTKLKYAPQKVGEIVVVCCILHNYAIAFGDNIIFEDIVNENALEPPPPAENISGLAFRNAFIQQHFA